MLKDADGDVIDIDVELTREAFDELIAPAVEGMMLLIRKLLLVGGSAQIPRFIGAMQREFGKEKVIVHERPMLAVAEGAAILSHRLADSHECPECGGTAEQSDAVCKSCGLDLQELTIRQGVLDMVHTAAHLSNATILEIVKNGYIDAEQNRVIRKAEVITVLNGTEPPGGDPS